LHRSTIDFDGNLHLQRTPRKITDMTPKEKADELFNKMDMIIYTDQDHDSQCKRCALIAVDEIIQQWEVIDTYVADFGGKLNQSLKFWQEVKQEIQAL
jgi:hypothetical protein